MGLPCFAADRESIDRLQSIVEKTPEVTITADVQSGVVTAGDVRIRASLPSALRDAFVSGQWNPTALLLDRFEEVREVATRLPYVTGFYAFLTRVGPKLRSSRRGHPPAACPRLMPA